MLADSGKFDFDVSRNEDFDVTLIVTGLDLTGYSAIMQVREYEGAPDALASCKTGFVTPNGSTISVISITPEAGSNPAVSTIGLLIATADLQAISLGVTPPADPDPFVYDLLFIGPDNIGSRYLAGAFNLSRGVSART